MILTALSGALGLATLIWLGVRRRFPNLVRREPVHKQRKAQSPSLLPMIGLPPVDQMLAIAAGLVLLISAVALYLDARQDPKTGEVIQELHQTIAKTRTLFATTSSYGSGNLTVVLVKGKAFRPEQMKDGNPIHALGGGVTVWGRGRGFEVSFDDLPHDVCAALISGVDLGPSLRNVIVNKISLGPDRLSTAEAALRCSDSNHNSITWILQ